MKGPLYFDDPRAEIRVFNPYGLDIESSRSFWETAARLAEKELMAYTIAIPFIFLAGLLIGSYFPQ